MGLRTIYLTQRLALTLLPAFATIKLRGGAAR